MYLTTSETRVKQKQTGWHIVITAHTDQGFMGRENFSRGPEFLPMSAFKNTELLFRVSLCRCIYSCILLSWSCFLKEFVFYSNPNVFLCNVHISVSLNCLYIYFHNVYSCQFWNLHWRSGFVLLYWTLTC